MVSLGLGGTQESVNRVRQVPDRFRITVLQHFNHFRKPCHGETTGQPHHLSGLKNDLHIACPADRNKHELVDAPRVTSEDGPVDNLSYELQTS